MGGLLVSFLLCMMQNKDLRGNLKPRFRSSPGSENNFKNIFGSGRGMLFWVGLGQVFYFTRDFRYKLESSLKKHAFHSQTKQVEWLFSLIYMLYDVTTSLQGVFTYLL